MEVHMADQRAVDGARTPRAPAFAPPYPARRAPSRPREGDLSTIGSSWQGSASVQFTQLMQQWQDNAAKVNQALQELADNLRGTDKAMQANEADTEGSFAQILGGL